MSIASELTNLAANRDAIKAAIDAKNPSVAPTTALSSFPAAIASIPTGGGGWNPPSEWPDIHAVIQQYPTGGSESYNKVIAVLFDLTVSRTVKITRCPYVRYSDAPSVVERGTTTGSVLHTFPSSAGDFGWVACYESDSGAAVYQNIQLGNGFSSVIPGTSNTSAPIGVLWASGKGRTVDAAYDCKSVQMIDTVDDSASVAGYNNSFNGSTHLRVLSVKKAVKSTTTVLRNTFKNCFMLERIDTSDWDTSGCTSFEATFGNCVVLKSVDITGWDASNATTFSPFATAYALETLIGDKRFSDLSIDSTKGPKVGFDLSNSPFLSADSLRFVVNWIGTVTSSTKLTLGAYNKSKLTDAEIAVATAKGWTVA